MEQREKFIGTEKMLLSRGKLSLFPRKRKEENHDVFLYSF